MADTLREYLIKLGFQVDENGWKGFNSKVMQSSRHVAELGAATVGAAATIGIAVEKVAKQYESLFYLSQRTGSVVGDIKAQEFGFQRIGLTADQARGSVEAFASAMRTNPGAKSMFASWGIDTNDAARGSGQLIDRIKNMPFFLAKSFAEMAGIDEATLIQRINNRDKEIRQEKLYAQVRRDAGIDDQKAAAASVRYADMLGLTEAKWSTLVDRVMIGWLPVAEKVVDGAGQIADVFIQVDKATDGVAGKIVSFTLALGGARVAIGLILKMLGLGGAAAAGGSLGLSGWAMRLLGPVGAFAYGLGLGGQANANETPLRGGAHPSDMGGTAAAMEFFKSKGWTPEQAAGIVANLNKESPGLNPRAVGDGGSAYGLAQWHPDRQRNFARWAGHDIRDSTLREQMEFVHYELTQGTERLAGNALRGTRSAREAGQTVSRMYERPADVLGEASARGLGADAILSSGGGSSASISQKTEINIQGVSDPVKAASLASDAQTRVNGDIVRNSKSLFQ